jgi:hypothetical protein
MAMHHTRRKKALSLIGESKDFAAMSKLLLENEFTADEVSEVLNAIEEGPATDIVEDQPTGKSIPAKAEKKAGYEEWRMERTGTGELVKLKRVREGVKITEAEAETLNAGATSPGAVNPIMYLKPE